jgi:DNA-binding TFAR19-related protein (PDSD5 family)
MVRPEKARKLEDFLIQAAQAGQLRAFSSESGRISEENLISILEKISEQESAASSKITVLCPKSFFSLNGDLLTIRKMTIKNALF